MRGEVLVPRGYPRLTEILNHKKLGMPDSSFPVNIYGVGTMASPFSSCDSRTILCTARCNCFKG